MYLLLTLAPKPSAWPDKTPLDLTLKMSGFWNQIGLLKYQERDFDLIISNPPYIAVNDPHLQQGDVRYEPSTALISAENGLKDIRVIAEQTPGHLKICGHLLIEHGYNQQADVQAIFKALNYRNVTTHSDLSGQPRVTSGLWKPL